MVNPDEGSAEKRVSFKSKSGRKRRRAPAPSPLRTTPASPRRPAEPLQRRISFTPGLGTVPDLSTTEDEEGSDSGIQVLKNIFLV